MPDQLLDFEKSLRAAALAVKDIETYRNAIELIEIATVENINSLGKDSRKSALNFATESLIKHVCTAEQIDMVLVKFKLAVIDHLLFREASLTALEHPDTKKSITIISEYADKILCSMLQGGKPNEKQKKIIAVSHALQEQRRIATSIRTLDGICDGLDRPNLGSKVLVVCEWHHDCGSSLFLNGLKDDLVKADYTNLCLEYCGDLTKPEYKYNPTHKKNEPAQEYANIVRLTKFAAQPEFIDKMVIIDFKHIPRPDLLISIKESLFMEFLGPMVVGKLRDYGMAVQTMLNARKHDGKIIVVIGAGHGSRMMRSLENLGIDAIAVAAFVDPGNLQLTQTAIGCYKPKPVENNPYADLFNKYNCQPINMRDGLTEGLLREFAAKHLPPVRTVSAPACKAS